MSDPTVEPVQAAFQRLHSEFVKHSGREPTRCVLAFDVARRAAQEHDGAAPMFQSWHPTLEFEVSTTAPPSTMYLA